MCSRIYFPNAFKVAWENLHAWGSAADAPKSRTEERSRLVWRWLVCDICMPFYHTKMQSAFFLLILFSIQVIDSDGAEIGQFCGRNKPPHMTSKGSTLTLRMKTDKRFGFPGFLVMYTTNELASGRLGRWITYVHNHDFCIFMYELYIPLLPSGLHHNKHLFIFMQGRQTCPCIKFQVQVVMYSDVNQCLKIFIQINSHHDINSRPYLEFRVYTCDRNSCFNQLFQWPVISMTHCCQTRQSLVW